MERSIATKQAENKVINKNVKFQKVTTFYPKVHKKRTLNHEYTEFLTNIKLRCKLSLFKNCLYRGSPVV